ncbi:MAG TPA: helix-turn-helix domain-containing protein [Burkholderiaceae bacterium]|jgi:hypothetical protein
MSLFPTTPPERLSALHAIRDRHPGVDCRAQCARILEALQTLGNVNTFEGTRHLDAYDVRARTMQLRNAGHNIITIWRHILTEAGTKHRVGVYVLVKGKNT